MSGIDLSIYTKRRNIIICEIEKIIEIAKSLKNKTLEDTSKKLIEELLDNKFNVVVVGEFSRGKSMFINALIGRKILPSSTKPTTAILNRISYADKCVFKIQYRDGKREVITEEEFKDIVAPKEPYEGDKESEQIYRNAVEKINKIEFADIEYPVKLCKDGIEIVDTPGTNDLDAAREEITYKFIPNSDAAIMLLSAQQILTESEMNFLKDRIIAEDIKKIFFVINFKDRVRSEESQKKIVKYAEEHLGQVINNPKIFMVSAKGALNYKRAQNNETIKGEIMPMEATGFMELEEAMSKFLSVESGRGKLLKHIQKARNLIGELDNNSINISLASLDTDLKELEANIRDIKSEIVKVRTTTNEAIKSLKISLSNAEVDITNKLNKDLDRIAYSAIEAINNYEGELETDSLTKYIEGVVAPMQTDLQRKMNKIQKDTISINISRITMNLGYEWDNLEKMISKKFKIKSKSDLVGIEEEYEEVLMTNGGIGVVGMLLGATFLNISFMVAIPAMILGGKHIFKFFKKLSRDMVLNKVKEQVKKRYYDNIPIIINNFRTGWGTITDKVVNEVEIELNRKLDSLGDHLNNIVCERSEEQIKVDEKRANLLEMRYKLDNINKNLNKLYDEINS